MSLTSRQTRRISLGTTDLQQAKEILTDWFVDQHRPQQVAVKNMSLAEVLTHYWENHAQHLPSKDTAKRACREWLEFFQ